MLLAGSLNRQELIAGVMISLIVTILFGSRFSIFTGIRFSLLLPVYILQYLASFFVALVVANIEMTRRILSPSLPIRPEIVEVRTRLQSPLGKMLLANTITLTPGTLTVDIKDDKLQVHWMYSPEGVDSKQATSAIASKFEHYLCRFLI
jgi:multicomponent Na+:H+ antiporter subunit E